MEAIISALGAVIMAKYIHERPDWPKFQWDQTRLEGLPLERSRVGRAKGACTACLRLARACAPLPAAQRKASWRATARRSVLRIAAVVPAFCPPYGSI